MAEIKLRFNLDAEEVELVVDGKVATSTGPEVFQSWVSAYNEKHPVEAPVESEPVKPEAPVEEKVVETSPEEVDKPDEE